MKYPYRAMKRRKHITNKELAAHYGVHRNTVTAWLKAKVIDPYDLWSVYDFLKYMDAYRGIVDNDGNCIWLVSAEFKKDEFFEKRLEAEGFTPTPQKEIKKQVST